MVRDIKTLLSEVSEELLEEAEQQRTPDEIKLHAVAQKLLAMERDLKVPGATRSSDERATQILDAIAKEDF